MARSRDFDTNLPVGPALHHEEGVDCAALYADGVTVLVATGGKRNVFAWDIHAITSLEDISTISGVSLALQTSAKITLTECPTRRSQLRKNRRRMYVTRTYFFGDYN